jgi:hypothetical protein
MKVQLLHRAIKGTPVVSWNTVTCTVHFGSLLDRSTTPAFSPPPPSVAPLAFAALFPSQPRSSPAPPLPAWRGRGYWRADVRPANLKTVDADPSTSSPATTTSRPATSGHEPSWIRPLRPSREQLLHSRSKSISHQPPKSICYIFMSMWIN